MERFAQQCTHNLKTWEARSSELLMVSPDTLPEAPDPMSQSRLPEDFSNAFPMTLPNHLVTSDEQADTFLAWQPTEVFSSSPDTSSEYSYPHFEIHSIGSHATSQLPSPFISPSLIPSPCGSFGSCLLSPRSEHSTSYPYCRPSSVGSSTSIASNATIAIRAAYHASVRKKGGLNRNSWNMSPLGSTPPPPPRRYFDSTISTADQVEKDLNARIGVPATPVSLVDTVAIPPRNLLPQSTLDETP